MRENVIQKDASDLIYLVSCAVNDEKPDIERCKKIDPEAVYYLAQDHSLTSAVAFALERVTVLPRPYDQAMKKAIHKLALFDIEREKIISELEKNSVWYLPLKGVLLKDCYPKSAMREMSDNDILFDSEKAETVKNLMEGMGYCCEMYGEYHHDTYTKQPTMEFEMHRMLFDSEDMPQFAQYYGDIKDRLVKDEGNGFGYHMTDEDFYIYVLCHIYKHYIYAGTGLRSLLDIYLYNNKYRETLDEEYLGKELSKLGLVDIERMIRVLSQKTFDLEELSGEEQKLLAGIIESGVYGTEEKAEYNIALRALDGDDSKKSKRRYLLKRVFVSGEELKKHYPLVDKHKVLYPLLFVYRPVKSVARSPKGIVNEVKRIKGFRKK